LNDQPSSVPTQWTVPPEVASILESTFQRILAESTFADAWPRPELASRSETVAEVGFHVLLPVRSPGFHSVPDAMVDKAIALDFLAEIATFLVRDLFCVSDTPVDSLEPLELSPDEAMAIWEQASTARTVLGCNQGRILAALLAGK